MAGIYVHFPFCRSRCIYCDFYSRTGTDWSDYISALGREIERRKEFWDTLPSHERTCPSTLYFGGGTPSLLPAAELERVVTMLRTAFGLSGLEEFTVECNPDDIDAEKASSLRAIGANRVSMGVQSFNDGHLKWMHRRHSADDARKAFHTLRNNGFGNISIDLIFGFEALSDEVWKESVDSALELRPEHISCYQMMGKYASADETSCERQYFLLQEMLDDAGYTQYEISNFSLPGMESRHNSAYWKREPYLGLGAAAHSFDGKAKRLWNISDKDAYMKGHSGFSETLSDREIEEEVIMLGLRTREGIALETAQRKPAFNKLVEAGYLEVLNSAVRICRSRLFVADWIISQLFD